MAGVVQKICFLQQNMYVLKINIKLKPTIPFDRVIAVRHPLRQPFNSKINAKRFDFFLCQMCGIF